MQLSAAPEGSSRISWDGVCQSLLTAHVVTPAAETLRNGNFGRSCVQVEAVPHQTVFPQQGLDPLERIRLFMKALDEVGSMDSVLGKKRER